VFAAVFGAWLLQETMNFRETSGCVLVFSAVILSQLPIPMKKRHD
jgi:drug/metabolite transporter (DMT)-like permease